MTEFLLQSVYFVGMLKDPGHPMATFVIGEFVSETDGKITLKAPFRAMEVPTQQGIGLQFMPDTFFTVETPSTMDAGVFWMHRLLDPEKDIKSILQIKEFYQGLRASRSGIVTPKLDSTAITKRMLNETK